MPVYDKSGEIEAMETVSRDITDRKRVEEDLERSGERLRTLTHSLM